METPLAASTHPVGFEVVRSVYCLADDKKSDLLVIKGNDWKEDGTIVPTLRFIENYKRPFYVTKPGLRNHNDLREWEHKDNLIRYTCPQHELPFRIARALGKHSGTDYRMLADSPYLYGSDVSTPTLLKYQTQKKYPDCKSPLRTVATLDIEATPDERREVLIVTVFYQDKSYLWINQDWAGNDPFFVQKVHEEWQKRLGPMLKRPCELIINMVPNAAACVVKAVERLHSLMPDFVSIWNMDYDIPTMMAELDRAGYDKADVMSDPKVPQKYRTFKYIKGKGVKVKAGKEHPIHPADQWHKPIFPATWFPVDSMGVYRTIRLASGMEPDYTLDGVLGRQLGLAKLKMEGTEHLDGLRWHLHMQSKEKIVYCAYASWDGISLAYLEEKTQDLAVSFPILCDNSEFETFKSNPNKIIDDMHLYVDERGYVMGTRPRQVEDEFDKYVCTLDGWIVTLPAYQMANKGFKCIAELPEWPTRIFIQNGDIDITTTYPKVEEEMNLSKGTTYSELSSIEGFNHEKRAKFGINAIAGEVNAIETCMVGFDLPSPDQWVDMFELDLLNGKVSL